jgi:hypothetical protein
VTDPNTDPSSAGPDAWSTPFTDAELADLLGLVDNPTSPLVVAGLAGTLYDDPSLDEPLTSGGDSDGH